MDGIANVARQQQTQTSTQEIQGGMSHAQMTQQTKAVETQTPQNAQKSGEEATTITSAKEVEDIVSQLNEALEPISTSLKFGVDSDDVFFVSVIDTESNEMIKRFPAERAVEFLPKMQEVTGMLFDSRG